ncbi:MAG TPA: Ppx/GppA family phosphatase [Candidatus Binatia bacterium]|nr:Ppx/GppA family phosphatase [Candidatus Binatia bacterium]
MPSAARDGRPVAAVLDVGTNSVLLLVVALGAGGRARVLDEALVTTRLGAGLAAGGTLDAAARARTTEAVVSLAARARGLGADHVWALATGAARRAADGAAFARALGAAARVPVEVLSGDREARLAYAAVAHGLDVATGPLLVVDVGGGTTELALGDGGTPGETASVPLGALALTEAHLRDDPPSPAALERVRAAVAAVLADALPLRRARAAGARLAASGGSATALAALALGLEGYDGRRVHGHVLDRAALAALVARVTALPLAARARLGALDPGRAAILPAGALVLAGVVETADAPAITVSDHGVRHAYLRERLAAAGMVADLRGEPA